VIEIILAREADVNTEWIKNGSINDQSKQKIRDIRDGLKGRLKFVDEVTDLNHIGAICDEAGVPHPTIVSESGRAIAAHHSVLVFEVLEVADPCGATIPEEVPDDVAQPVRDLFDAHGELSRRNMREAFHDAQQSLEMANAMFSTGHLSLTHRSLAERLFWGICRRVRDMTATLDYVPEELQDLDALLAATYFGNFSIFQSLPDSWAIKQLFPVMPIHRLDERPTAQAIIGDVTCDSDGKIDRFVNRRDVRNSISVHSLNGSPYYLGVFLVGAYQEILGDLHNLFGDTNAVHVDVSSDGKIIIETIVEGDTVDEVLRYVQFDPQELVEQLRNSVAVAVEEQRIDEKQARNFIEFYKSGLQGYTYLE
jgi:arginine decarboxylase